VFARRQTQHGALLAWLRDSLCRAGGPGMADRQVLAAWRQEG